MDTHFSFQCEKKMADFSNSREHSGCYLRLQSIKGKSYIPFHLRRYRHFGFRFDFGWSFFPYIL